MRIPLTLPMLSNTARRSSLVVSSGSLPTNTVRRSSNLVARAGDSDRLSSVSDPGGDLYCVPVPLALLYCVADPGPSLYGTRSPMSSYMRPRGGDCWGAKDAGGGSRAGICAVMSRSAWRLGRDQGGANLIVRSPSEISSRVLAAIFALSCVSNVTHARPDARPKTNIPSTRSTRPNRSSTSRTNSCGRARKGSPHTNTLRLSPQSRSGVTLRCAFAGDANALGRAPMMLGAALFLATGETASALGPLARKSSRRSCSSALTPPTLSPCDRSSSLSCGTVIVCTSRVMVFTSRASSSKNPSGALCFCCGFSSSSAKNFVAAAAAACSSSFSKNCFASASLSTGDFEPA
mmetsp:Transcript_17252/g.41322  ORF Transcript_17252/g.41322 Transcript_17252/m.41322 type:complete len:348 (+) Transcript_17252:1016-2059(+)